MKDAEASVTTGTQRLVTTDPHLEKKVSVAAFQDAIGAGKKVTLSVTDPRSRLRWWLAIEVYDRFAGLRLDWGLENSTGKELNLRDTEVIKAGLPPSAPGFMYAVFPHVLINGLLNGPPTESYAHVVTVAGGETVRSYDQIAVDHPKLVAGYLAAKHIYGRFRYSFLPTGMPELLSTAEFNVLMDPGQTRSTDPLLLLFPKDLFEGLETYASFVAEFNRVHVKPYTDTAWCSWYSGYGFFEPAGMPKLTEPETLEKAMLVNARLMAPLVPLGVDTLRVVDDSHEQRYGDWNFPFVPHGMGELAASLRAFGRKPGVWLSPALVSEASEVYRQHPDWLQRDSSGELITGRQYGNTMHYFDASNPAVLLYLRNLFTRIRESGYQYVMIDWLGTFGLSNHYYDPHLTRAEIYRRALSTIRDALGPHIYLLGCAGPQLASVGLVDGMRIGPDAWGKWGYENVAARYYEARKWWLNDPDALVGNNRPVEEYRAWVTLAAMSGSVITIGDDLGMLAREKLGILERILPAEGRVGTPIDLFRSAPSNVWFLPTSLPGGKSGVLSLFNWGGKIALTHNVNLANILGTKGKVLAYDFWNDYLQSEKHGDLEVSVPPHNVRTFCLVETRNHPQVIEVSNFLPQTGWGLRKVRWEAETKVLQGETEGLSGEIYHVVFYSPKPFAPLDAVVDGQKAFLVEQQESVWGIRVTGTGRSVEWSVRFRVQ